MLISATTTLGGRINPIDNEKSSQNSGVVVYISSNALPKDNTNQSVYTIEVSNKDGSFTPIQATLSWGGPTYHFDVNENNNVVNLQANWASLYAAVNVFDPARDIGHTSVYWLVKPDGLYLSWDNSSWQQKAVWLTS
ncbi:hypothetical protein G4B88_026767 [Cannabis sativa]|uniref:Uncharacterized protein n=1 Tax=Cannabis sativa TaxID=3483 RepID=A0A7J6FBV9_CANSA|nr:hypothetical protein G4B88_026767 [Cannabis sativa]